MVMTLPKLDWVDATIVMRDQYYTRLGIYNHLNPDPKRPLASVAMFDEENFTEKSALYDTYEDYAEKNYYEVWGLSLDEFLSRPRYEIKMMKEITERLRAKKSAAIAAITNEPNKGK